MTYKPEIDGLRAIAVILVLLCHMKLGFSGGFIGVDVFFVISGFLITSIILKEIGQEKFSLLKFYGRRIVRLYPALIVTIVLTFTVGFLLASPEMLANLAKTGKYTLASISNLYFYKNQGYFAVDALQQPFLHTWTLGIEWQFYLITPVLIWLLSKISKEAILIGLAVLVGASCAASAYQVAIDVNHAYYLLPYRAFELGIGGLLVFFYEKQTGNKVSWCFLLLGIAAILWASLAYSSSTKFPGRYALLPCLGAAACIYGGKNILKGNFLRWRPVIYIGKASYSIYLVHWPLLVFYIYYVFRDLNTIEKCILAVSSILLGVLVYELVEKRMSWRKLSAWKYGHIAGVSAIFLTSLLIGIGFHWVQKSQGLTWRVSNAYINNSDYMIWAGDGYDRKTVLGKKDAQPIALLTGDSFAMSYALGFDEILNSQGKAMFMETELGCLISKKYKRADLSDRGSCDTLFKEVFGKNQDLPIVINQAWPSYFHRLYSDGQHEYNFSFPEKQMGFLKEILDDFKEAAGNRKLILISSTPYFGSKDKRIVMRPTYLGETKPKQYHPKELLYFASNEFIRDYAKQHENVYFIDVTSIACPDNVCSEERSAVLYHDDSHFSRYGSRLVGDYVLQELEKILKN